MTQTSMAIAIIAAISGSVVALGGCVSAVDRDYGKAVYQMVTAQVYHPETLREPSDKAIEGVDPDSAKAAVDAMRKDTAERAHTEQPVIFTYGGPGAPSQ